MKKSLFLFPHPDDELLVGGALLYSMAGSRQWEVYVAFATNGDFYAHEGSIRIMEAVNSCKKLGVSENNIIFMGYGNEWKRGNIYNCSPNEELVSAAGFDETYGYGVFSDYAYIKNGVHHKYTRSNYKCDLVDIIKDHMPEVIVCVDLDSHPDHRTLHLLFREALKSILTDYENYKPLVLTKFAYEGVMKGEKDYYCIPHRRTKCKNSVVNSAPYPLWDSRISFRTPCACDGVRLTCNPLFLASLQHRSQHIWERMISAINADIVYWRIPSENLALKARVQVSSGEEAFINDMKIIDSNEISVIDCRYDAGIWVPDDSDKKRTISLFWESKHDIRRIEVFVNGKQTCNRASVRVFVGDCSYDFQIEDFHQQIKVLEVNLERQITTDRVDIQIVDTDGNFGISEICVYSDGIDLDEYKLPLSLINETEEGKSRANETTIVFMDKLLYGFIILISRVIIAKYAVQRKYPVSVRKRIMIPFFGVVLFFHKLFRR